MNIVMYNMKVQKEKNSNSTPILNMRNSEKKLPYEQLM